MINQNKLDPNKIAQYLDKPSAEFSKKDLMKYVAEHHIKMINFRHAAGDGKLKALNFIIQSMDHLDRILSAGERVDGSSLFKYIDASSSDLYVVPRYKTAFVNPFSKIPAIDILCSYYTNEGNRLASSPENIVKNSQEALQAATGYSLYTMGELEYYIFNQPNPLYIGQEQKGYHESAPFSKGSRLRLACLEAIAQCGGSIKYGHSEVGNFRTAEYDFEQHEIEFLPVPMEDAADQLAVAKWIIRMLAYQYGITISFAPKIMIGHAGSGLHIHTKLVDANKKNVMVQGNQISDTAKKVIAGYLELAPSLAAFGNKNPVSFLRLVPHQEAPTNICWGDRNRSVLVRVPLGWLDIKNMIKDANPKENEPIYDNSASQTVEFRAPDGSANIYHLMAGLGVAARHGLEMKNSLQKADSMYMDVNIFKKEHQSFQEKLQQLPGSCYESAEYLLKQRKIYEKDNVFSPIMIDGIADELKAYNDANLSERLYGKETEIKKLVEAHLHC